MLFVTSWRGNNLWSLLLHSKKSHNSQAPEVTRPACMPQFSVNNRSLINFQKDQVALKMLVSQNKEKAFTWHGNVEKRGFVKEGSRMQSTMANLFKWIMWFANLALTWLVYVQSGLKRLLICFLKLVIFLFVGFFLFTESNMLVFPGRKYRNYLAEVSAPIKGPQMSRSKQAVAQFTVLPLAGLSDIICRYVSPALILSSIFLSFENLILKENSGNQGRNRRNWRYLKDF